MRFFNDRGNRSKRIQAPQKQSLRLFLFFEGGEAFPAESQTGQSQNPAIPGASRCKKKSQPVLFARPDSSPVVLMFKGRTEAADFRKSLHFQLHQIDLNLVLWYKRNEKENNMAYRTAIFSLNRRKNCLVSLGLMLMFMATSCTPKLSPGNTQLALQAPVIPRPAFVEKIPGRFRIGSDFRILLSPASKDTRSIAEFLAIELRDVEGLKVPVGAAQEKTPRNTLTFQLSVRKEHLGDGGYELEIYPNEMVLTAHKPSGLFYGVQTLLQLLPPNFKSSSGTPDSSRLTWPCLKIIDKPRFSYRGMHLDVGRHFFSKSFIKKYIDLLAMHKFNMFHWHLTEDQGWRIEIKKYPKLTEISSYRKETLVGHYRDQPHKFDGQQYGGYYTQEDIREIVQYAKERYITIIPEIEMPGHSVAVLAGYPELSCTGGPFDVSTLWGVKEDVYCAGDDRVFEFLEDVLTEVMDLFPSTYIHIGGDECPKVRWKNCEKCQTRIKEEGLRDEDELQSYFIRRIETFLLSKGKKLIGWDEILEGGLAPEATVMSWRGTRGGIEAAKQGHDVIMTPVSHCYFDYYQADPETEPLAIGGYTTLKKVYSFEPIPRELSDVQANHIIGAQGNVWTEYIKTPEYVEYMSVPRMTALSEVLWSPKEARHWKNFRTRLETFYDRLDLLNVNFSQGSFRVEIVPRFDHRMQTTSISLESEQLDPPILYSTGESGSSPEVRKYERPFPLTKTMTVRAGIYIDGELKEQISEKTFLFHRGVNKGIRLLTPFSDSYPAGGERAVIDGVTGSENHRDGNWQGYEEQDLIVLTDLREKTYLRKIAARFLQNNRAWIFFPSEIRVALSNDGSHFETIATIANDVSLQEEGSLIREFAHHLNGVQGRYIRIHAKNIGVLPDWHPNVGEKCWIFIDEIVIQ